jgi:hypothetical protein
MERAPMTERNSIHVDRPSGGAADARIVDALAAIRAPLPMPAAA